MRQMPDQVVPKEWAPDEGEPRYVTAMKLIKRFNELSRREEVVRLAVALALVECAPAPDYARWAIAIVALAAYGVLWFKVKRVQRAARDLEDLNPTGIKVRPAQEEQPDAAASLQEQKA